MTSATETGALLPDIVDEIGEAIADSLTAHSFDVRKFASQELCLLQLTNVQATLVNLEISPNRLDWEYRSFGSTPRDPARATAITLAILDAKSTTPACPDTHATLKDHISHAAASHGMHTGPIVLDPRQPCDVVAITNPASPSRGTVWVSDDGTIYWHCHLDHSPPTPQPAPAEGTPASHPAPADQPSLHPAEIADTIARALATVPRTN